MWNHCIVFWRKIFWKWSIVLRDQGFRDREGVWFLYSRSGRGGTFFWPSPNYMGRNTWKTWSSNTSQSMWHQDEEDNGNTHKRPLVPLCHSSFESDTWCWPHTELRLLLAVLPSEDTQHVKRARNMKMKNFRHILQTANDAASFACFMMLPLLSYHHPMSNDQPPFDDSRPVVVWQGGGYSLAIIDNFISLLSPCSLLHLEEL